MFFVIPPEPGNTLPMEPVTPEKTGRTVPATTSFSVAPQTTAGTKWLRGVLTSKKKKKCCDVTEMVLYPSSNVNRAADKLKNFNVARGLVKMGLKKQASPFVGEISPWLERRFKK